MKLKKRSKNNLLLFFLLVILTTLTLGLLALQRNYSYKSRAASNNPKVGDIIERQGMKVKVPLPGHHIFTEEILEDGTTRAVKINTKKDGTVEIKEGKDIFEKPEIDIDEPESLNFLIKNAYAQAAEACDDPKYTILRDENKKAQRLRKTLYWYLNRSSIPAKYDKSTVATLIKRAANNITQTRTDCGSSIDKNIIAKNSYIGSTDALPEKCRKGDFTGNPDGDGKNVVAFYNLGTNLLGQKILGKACIDWQSSYIFEVDILLDDQTDFWLGGRNCAGFSLQGVTTHEWGHAFGLGHADPYEQHYNLTMAAQENWCDGSHATLGLGDLKGLYKLYPTPQTGYPCALTGDICYNRDTGSSINCCESSVKCVRGVDGNGFCTAPTPTPKPGCGYAGCCTSTFSTNGGIAQCQNASLSCSGGYVDGYCGVLNTKCCVPTTTKCYQQLRGKCQTVGGSQSCPSPFRYTTGHCPGPSTVQCCYVSNP